VVIDHPTDGTLYGYSGQQTVVDPANPDDRWYQTDGPFVPQPHIFQEWENNPGHPSVGFAFIRGYKATGNKFLMRAAKKLGDTLISAQSDIGVGGWWQDMGLIGHDVNQNQMVTFNQWKNLQGFGDKTWMLDNDQDLSSFDGCSYLAGYFLLRLYQALPAGDPDRDRYLQSAKWLADEIVGFKDVVDNPGGFNPYGQGGVPQIWPYNTMKSRPGYEGFPSYPYSLSHNVMVTLSDDAMGGALFFLMEFWKESQTNQLLDEATYRNAVHLNIDYLMDVFDSQANPNGNSAWADFYWINDGSSRANTPTWGRAYEPPALNSIAPGDEPLMGWLQYETDQARIARIEDTLLRHFLYFRYDAPPVNSRQIWRDLIRDYMTANNHNAQNQVDGYDASNISTWYWWYWYNHDTTAAPREVFVGAQSLLPPNDHYDIHYDLDALNWPSNNPDNHYAMMRNIIGAKMFVALDLQNDTLKLFSQTDQNHNNRLIDRYNLDMDVRMFRGRPNPAGMVGTALAWFDPADGFFKPTGSLPTVTRNSKSYPYVSDFPFQVSMRYLAAGFENGTGTVTDSDGDGYLDAAETSAGTDIYDSEDFPTVPGTLQFSPISYNNIESAGSVTVRVSRTAGSLGAVTVDYATSDGTATAGSDYTSASGTLNWAHGDTADKILVIPILNDALTEADETIN
jgi:hypothetical protein